ncbi:MAG: FAD-dependent monooxygenase [Hylemonella sp.]|uniref:FAD-dependent monooxygenase n=1 Tax=Hylemonella sp. TaxID=2066020 RepID=UPI00391D2641
MPQALDICIRGSGIVGRTLALLLARERLRVGLVEQPAATPPGADVRAYALNRTSRELLESVRAWPEDEATATPVLHMQVWGDRGSELNFNAASLGSSALTWIVDVPELEARLAEAVRYQPQIEVLAAPLPAKLTVICEGRASRTRAEFGVDFDVTPYPQHALATRLRCEKPHGQVARQWFAQGEILAFLPLGGPQGNSVAVVWSVSAERAAQLQQLEPVTFCQEIAHASQQTLGPLSLISERKTWPLQKALARQWSGRNAGGAWVLAGDAAHNVHPLAGQGLNLGLADVAELTRVLHGREYWRGVDDEKLLRRYERTRKAGMLALDVGMDGLQLLFAREGQAWSALRNWGLQGVERSGWLKHWLAHKAMNF